MAVSSDFSNSNAHVQVVTKVPTRIDLAGGTLDLWPIHQLLERKATVNIGISLDAQVQLVSSKDGKYHLTSQDLDRHVSGDFLEVVQTRSLPLVGMLIGSLWSADLPPIMISTSAKSPAGAGLGGSSCLGIAIAAALCQARYALGVAKPIFERDLVRIVQDIEAKLIHAPTGCQDYWGGLRGGVNVIEFPPGGERVTTLDASSSEVLDDQLIVCFSGKSRASAINNWEIFKRLFDGDQQLLDRFQVIGELSERCAAAVKQQDFVKALQVSKEEWALRTALWPNIETAETKKLDHAALQAGAMFSRVCGAGGGGVMAVFCQPNKKTAVVNALTTAGGFVLNGKVSKSGLTINGGSIDHLFKRDD